jgi:Family of unknown function (DUF5996)
MIVSGSHWRPIRGVDRAQFCGARLQAHHAVQWLARAARAYVAPQPDDGHTCLIWDRPMDGLITQPLRDGTRMSLRVTDLTIGLHPAGATGSAPTLMLDGRHEMSIRDALGMHLDALLLDASDLDAPAPYEIPAHAVGEGKAYDATGSADALAELAAWFANAELLLSDIRRHMIERNCMASPVCCWPHHFDLATLTMLPTPAPEATGSVGAGFSPGDKYYDEPYFYVSVYPDPDAAALPGLPRLGHWHTHDFTAAILPAHKLMTAADQQVAAEDFLRGAVATAIKLLS